VSGPAFADRVLAWWQRHGRKDLPWQRRPTAYRVWISEIMLQQTQVATAAPYFQRFVARFPGVRALAGAPIDEVLALWSGLGYYARARNLHRAAGLVVDRHRGRFPRSLDALSALPGIGRSTAGAILSLAFGQRAAILDGNVKRVLCRHAGVAGWPGDGAVQRELWAIAEARLPEADFAAYTQAIMDLGATICTTRAPACAGCPVHEDCHALANGRVLELPDARPRKAIPQRAVTFVLARDRNGRILLERRPPAGVWGGLWGPPECATPDDVPHCLARLGLTATAPARPLAPVQHTFSHFRLRITPVLVDVEPARAGAVADAPALRWIAPGSDPGIGLAAPVARLVASCARDTPEPAREVTA
jgi:A/G-specific adenine glycosylase